MYRYRHKDGSWRWLEGTGTNLLAVEIHQFATNSPDLSFDLELIGLTDNPTSLLPRLMAQRSGSFVLSWPAAYSGWSLYTEAALTGGDRH